jgi:hypothetical protein
MNPVHSLLPIAGDVAVHAISRLAGEIPFAQVLRGEQPVGQRAGATSAGRPASVNPEFRLQYEALLQNIHRMRDALHEKMQHALAARGLETDEPLAVTEDTEGRLLESSGSWDRAEIERLLEEDPVLADGFRELFHHVQTLRGMALAAQGLPEDADLSPVRLWMDDERAVIQTLA